MVAKQKELRERLGLHEFIKFLQSYSDGKGDYTKEKYENNEELTIDVFEKYLAGNTTNQIQIKTILKKRVVFLLLFITYVLKCNRSNIKLQTTKTIYKKVRI